MADLLYGISFFLSLGLVGILWWKSAKTTENRRIWIFLAIAWMMNLVADLAWGILYLIETDLWLDWIDYLYILRYFMVFFAFWPYPKGWHWKQWLAMIGSMLIGWLLVWLLIARPAANPDPEYALTGMIFPVMDVGLIYAAWVRWKTDSSSLKPSLLWISGGMLTYGIANWFNYGTRINNPEGDNFYALVFWLLTTVFVGIGTLAYKERT